MEHSRYGKAGSRVWLNPAARARRAPPPSVPEILEPLGVASLGLATTDADHVETLRDGLEGANDRRSYAQDVPDREIDDLVIELVTTRTGDHEVDIIQHQMPLHNRNE